MKQYNKANIPLAKDLRKNMTSQERKLWYNFLRDYPIRFQRKKAIGDYIADFYCVKARLVIELDGGGHYETHQQQLDQKRTEALQAMNLTGVRFSNADVERNFRGVCEQIDMNVKKSLPQSTSLTAPSSEGAKDTVFALGVFDGVHLGHRALLDACAELAQVNGCKSGAVTFLDHPDALVLGKMPPLINTPADRKKLLSAFGAQQVLELPFDKEMMAMPWQRFLEMLVTKHGAAGFVCGADFRFGHKGLGNPEKLSDFCAENGLSCRIVPQITLDGTIVSSSHIRNLLEQGDMENATRFLGHPHVLSGEVVSGRHLGRKLGIPTANLLPPEGLVALPHGVYACVVIVENQRHLAVTNIGNRPTVGGHRVTVEPWILDFDGDLYGKNLMLEFHKFLRPERKFASLEELQAQIQQDAAQVKAIL